MENNSKFMHIATKTSLLCYISSIAYVMNMVAAATLSYETLYKHFIWHMILLIDVYSSFLCVLMSFGRFSHWYYRLCGKLHTCCLTINERQFSIKDIKMMEKTVESPKPTLPATIVPSDGIDAENTENAEQNV